MSGQLIGRGYITIAGLKDGDPAKTYVLIPSVDSITKKLDGTLSVTGVTCSVYKVTGSAAYALTSDHTLSYVRTPDGAGGILIHAAGTSGSIAVLATTESIEFELKDGSKVIDRVRVPVLSDATDVSNELDTYSYLKEALAKQGTVADHGLLLTSLIALGYTDSNNVRHTLAGTNGIYVPKLGGRTIGSWWGGDMLDLFKADDTRKTYDELKTESGKIAPLAATSLVRMDGSAYFANGNIGFKADGSGWLGNENGIKWTPLGALTIGAGVTIDVTGDDGVKRTLTDVANFITAVTSLLAPADANGKELQWNQVAQAQTIMAKKTFFSLGGVSAKGIGSSTGGGGSVFGLYTDSTWAATPSTTDALGAVLGKSLHTRISALEGKNYLDELTLTEAGTGNAVTDVSLSNDKKTLTVTYGASYLSGITKAMVEGVLTGNITTHTHSQYLTEESLANYATTSKVTRLYRSLLPPIEGVMESTPTVTEGEPPLIAHDAKVWVIKPSVTKIDSGAITGTTSAPMSEMLAVRYYSMTMGDTGWKWVTGETWLRERGYLSAERYIVGDEVYHVVATYNSSDALVPATTTYTWTLLGKLYDGTGGGLDESQLADYLTTNNYAKKSDIPSLSGYATQAWVTGKGYLTSSSLHTLTIQKNGTTVGTYKPNADATINIADVASAATLENHLNNTTNHVAGAEKLLWNQTATKLNAILGEDSDTIINKWEEVVAFLDTYTEADTLANLLSNKVDKVSGKGLSTNDFTDAYRDKLNGLTNYSLPTATETVKGGVKVGSGLAISAQVLSVNLSASHIPSLPWSKITSGKPTTLAGYGITDAKIENGVITLGGKTITPITSHQSIYALTIKGNGTSLLTYNPKTEAAEIDITPAKIGASPSSHVHTQYAPVTALTNIYTKTEADNKFQPKGNYLTAITKAQVEAVLTGNITSHTHAQYAPVLLLANYVERVKLDNNTDIAALTGSHLYYSDTDGNTATMKNSPFAQSFMMLTQTCYHSGDDIRRARLAVDAWGGIKVFDDRGVSGTGGTWHTVLTDKNTKITNGTITINGASITPLISHQSLANYVTLNTAQRISGGKTFNNGALAVRQDKACGLTFYSFGDSDTERVAAIEILGASGSWLKNSLDFYKSGRIVARNSFTATSIIKSGGTASQLLAANGSVRKVLVYDDLSDNAIDIRNIAIGDADPVVTREALSGWDGSYKANSLVNGTATEVRESALAYCVKGAFGDIVTHGYGEFVTVLGTSGNNLTWTKNGASHSLTVPYATMAAYLTGTTEHTGTALSNFDTEHTRTYQATNNLGDGIQYSAILSVSAGSLHRYFQIIGGKGDPSFLRWRTTNSDASALGAVRRLLDDNNYSSILDSRYLKKAGDTMTGTLTINTSAHGEQLHIYRNAAGGNAAIKYSNAEKLLGYIGISGKNGIAPYQPVFTDSNANGYKMWHQGNDGSGSGLDADLWDGEQLSNFRMRKVYTLNLSSLSTSNFYPVTFGKGAWEMDCEIHSPSRGGAEAYNQNHIHFILTALGWSDTPARLLILSQGNFDSNEITIGAVGTGNQNGERCVWLRGGMNYTVIANAVPTLRTADYSDGNEKYTVGTNLYGGTNANVTIRWQNTDALRDSAKAATMQSNVASATKLQTVRKIFGVNFDGTGDVNGTVHAAAVEISHPTPFIDFHFGSSTADYTSRIIETASGRLSIEGKLSIGYVNDSYKLATSSFICNSWIRTVGSAGWYSETYGGGWCMTDGTWIRIHGGKSLYAASGIIRTDGELQVGGGGDKFRVTAAGAVTAASFTKRGGTAAQALMADGSVRRVITFDDLTDDGKIGVSDFDATLVNGLVSVSALTEWDGRVHWTKANQSSQTGTTEIYNCNLQYCALGKFGDVVTYSASDFLLAANLLKKTSVGDIGWGTAANQQKPLAMSAIAYWNGAYQGTSSNLAYCNKGAFGTMVTKNADDYVTRTTAQTISGVKTFTGEQKFMASGLSYSDPWAGTACAVKVTGKVGVTDSIKALSFIKAGGTSSQVLMADGSVRGVLTSSVGAESGFAIPASSPQNSLVEQWWLMLWDGRYMLYGDDTPHCTLQYCKHGKFGDIVTHNASEFLTSGSLSGYATQSWVNSQGFLKSHQSLANYVTLNTAQTVSGRKTFSDAIVNSYAMSFLFNYRGSTPAANAYGVMFYKRDTYFNILRTKKGAPDTVTFDHGGSLMEINLATNAVTFAGVVTASNISTSSDARLKTRIADISLPIADIAAAPLWRYRRKDTGVVDVGSTAQYWGAILPELTRTDEQGWMSLDYGKTALLASVSLARKADDHEARIKALEAENRALKQEIERIKAA